MNKTEIFIHVKDIDESRELLRVLKEARESIYPLTERTLEECEFPYSHPCICYIDGDWTGARHEYVRDMTQVTIPELRQILSGDTLNTDIAKLKDKYPDYCFTIIVEKR